MFWTFKMSFIFDDVLAWKLLGLLFEKLGHFWQFQKRFVVDVLVFQNEL